MEAEEEDATSGRTAQEEARQLMDLVRFLARTLGFNNSALARSANVPLATLVRYFKGEGEPKLEFLLSLVRAMGLEVREFFELAYPAPSAPSAARLKIDRILQQVQPGKLLQPPPAPPPPEPSAEPQPLRREDIERMLDDLRRDVREIVAARRQRTEELTDLARPPARKRKGED
jgi:AcrR family transcriptional regulator